MIVYGAAAGGEVPLDLLPFYRRRLQLIGLNTVVIDLVDGARILSELEKLFEGGVLPAPRVAARYRLEDAAGAYTPGRVVSGQGRVRALVAPGTPPRPAVRTC